MYTESAIAILNSYYTEPYASLINGIVFGQDLDRGSEIYTQLQDVGLIHIMVLSGSNISIVSALVIRLFIPLGRLVAIIVAILTIVMFVIYVGADPPLVRAALMGGLGLFGSLIGQKPLTMYLLLVSFVIILVFEPTWISKVSLQLSYAATIGIILFANLKLPIKKSEGMLSTLRGYILEEMRISIAAQLFTSPLIWFHFKQFSVVSPFANTLVSWTIAPLMLIGSATASTGAIHWHSGQVISFAAHPLLFFIVFITETLSSLPFAAIKQ